MDALRTVSGYSILVPLVVCIKFYPDIPGSLRNIVYFVWIATAGQVVSIGLYMEGISGLPALHAYTLVEGIILLLFYRQVLKQKYNSAYFTTAIILFFLFTVVNVTFIQSIDEINSNARTLEAALIIACTILYYFHLFESEGSSSFKRPLLWINSGIFLYFSMSLLFFAFGHYLMQNYTAILNSIAWRLHGVFLNIFHLILARGIWLLGKRANS